MQAMTRFQEIRITDIEEFDSVNVVEVLVRPGERVDIDQPLVTLESEKAVMDFPSPNAGVVQEINARKDERVRENDVLVTLKVTEENLSPEQAPLKPPPATIQEPAPNQNTAHFTREKSNPLPAFTKPNSAYASPGVYQYARELGVELAGVQGSGRQQRITKQDVQSHVRTSLEKKAPPSKIVSSGETEAEH